MGLEPTPILVGIDEVVERHGQLRMTVIIAPFEGGLLERDDMALTRLGIPKSCEM